MFQVLYLSPKNFEHNKYLVTLPELYHDTGENNIFVGVYLSKMTSMQRKAVQ